MAVPSVKCARWNHCRPLVELPNPKTAGIQIKQRAPKTVTEELISSGIKFGSNWHLQLMP